MHETDAPQGSADHRVNPALDAATVRRWYETTLVAFTRYRRTVDELNVFPVPDGDTGTNLAATMRAACEVVVAEPPTETLPEVARRAARGALLGARGNSGVILAQILSGLADTWTGDRVDGAGLAAGLRRGAASAAEAVAAPAEGTILTVAEAAADAAAQHAGSDLAEVCRQVSTAAAVALSATVTQLPALTRAGVVDAGGLGLALMLDCLVEVVTGEETTAALGAANTGVRTTRSRTAAAVPRESGSTEFAYEVQYLVDADPDSIDRLRGELLVLGDSLVIVGAAAPSEQSVPTWNVHVHVNDVGAAVEAGINTGRLYRLSVTRFTDQIDTISPASQAVAAGDRGIVVVAEGAGLARVLRAEGAHPVDTSSPSTKELLGAMRATGAGDLVILVDAGSHAVAESAATLARADGFRVAAIPTRSPVQALAALAVRDPGRRFDDDVIAMAEAAGACRHAEIIVAARAGLTSVGKCEAGDYLGLADGDIILLGPNLDEVLFGVADRLCAAGAELITVVSGADLPPGRTEALAEHLAKHWPMVDVQCLEGGQSRHLVRIGAE